MKKFSTMVYLMVMIVIFVGCGKKIDGSYNLYSDEVLTELIIEDEEVTIKMSGSNLTSSGFLGLNIKEEVKIDSLKGKVDTSKKQFVFSEEDLKLSYKVKDKKIIIKMDNLEGEVTMYPSDSPEYEKNIKEFNEQKSDNEQNNDMFKNQFKNDDDSEEKLETSMSSSNESEEEFTENEMDKVVKKIQESYMKQLVGEWVGKHSLGTDTKEVSKVTINEDGTYTATHTDANGRVNMTYTGKLEMTESNRVKEEIERLNKNKELAELSEIDTYEKYSKVVGDSSSRIELKNTMSTKGIKYSKEVNDVDEETIVNLKLYEGNLSFQDIIKVKEFSSYVK